jgi:hypothetical protein
MRDRPTEKDPPPPVPRTDAPFRRQSRFSGDRLRKPVGNAVMVFSGKGSDHDIKNQFVCND